MPRRAGSLARPRAAGSHTLQAGLVVAVLVRASDGAGAVDPAASEASAGGPLDRVLATCPFDAMAAGETTVPWEGTRDGIPVRLDLDGDGTAELALIDVAEDGTWWIGAVAGRSGRAGLGPRASVEIGTAGDRPLAWGRDVDGDGRDELLLAGDGRIRCLVRHDIPSGPRFTPVWEAVGHAGTFAPVHRPGAAPAVVGVVLSELGPALVELPIDLAEPGPTRRIVIDPNPGNMGWCRWLDVDGDGRRDLVTGGRTPTRWYRATAAAWDPMGELDVGPMQRPVVADLDGAAPLDLVAVGADLRPASARTAHLVTIRLERGRQPRRRTIALPWGDPADVRGIAAGDLDGDGLDDVVLRSFRGIDMLLGDGAGNLQPAGRFAAGIRPGRGDLAVMDLDGDGRGEIVGGAVGRVDTRTRVHWSRPDGLPGASIVGPRADSGSRLALVDPGAAGLILAGRDGVRYVEPSADGRELVVIDSIEDDDWYSISSIRPIEGRTAACLVVRNAAGYRTFLLEVVDRRSLQLTAIPEVGDTPFVGIGDLEGDGDLDIATGLSGDSRLDILLATDEGYVSGPSFFVVGSPISIHIADIDADGLGDLVLSDSAETLRVAFGHPDTVIGPVHLGPALETRSITLVDWDGDGRREIITNHGVARVTRFADGILRTEEIVPRSGGGFHLHSIVAADFEGDGGLWIIGTTPAYWRVLMGRVSGPLTAPEMDVREARVTNTIESPVAVDVDADGRVDLALLEYDGDSPHESFTLVVRLSRPCPPACLGDLDADGQVSLHDMQLMLAPADRDVVRPETIYDLDGDGDRDGDDLAVLLGHWGPCPS